MIELVDHFRPLGLTRGDQLVFSEDVPSVGWRVVFVQDRDEFVAPLAGPLRTAGVVLVLLLLLVGLLLVGLLVVLLAPSALLLIYRFLPVPITPLMVIRLIQGEGLRKDWVPLAEIAPVLPQAVIAAEDNRFCEHFGFDWAELGGQVDAYLAGERARGASTITMQTAKNLFLWPGRDLVRKALASAGKPVGSTSCTD